MNSTCRGEGEGLNCKTRRQRSCALKACGHKRCALGGGSAPWGRRQAEGCADHGTEDRIIAQGAERQLGKQPAQRLQKCRDGGTNQRTHKHINVTNRNEAEINQAGL